MKTKNEKDPRDSARALELREIEIAVSNGVYDALERYFGRKRLDRDDLKS